MENNASESATAGRTCSAAFSGDRDSDVLSQLHLSSTTVPSVLITPPPFEPSHAGNLSSGSFVELAEIASQVRRDLNSAWRRPHEWRDWLVGLAHKSRMPNAVLKYRGIPKEATKYGISANDDERAIGKKVARNLFKQIWADLIQHNRVPAEEGREPIPLCPLELYIINQWCEEKLGEIFPLGEIEEV
jgi:hypothetical protein